MQAQSRGPCDRLPGNRSRIVLTMAVTGWCWANQPTGPGIGLGKTPKR